MLNKLINIIKKSTNEIKKIKNVNNLEMSRIKYFGKKGKFSEYIKTVLTFPLREKKKFFLIINKIKTILLKKIKKKKETLHLKLTKIKLKKEKIDVSLPGKRTVNGSIHPITETIYTIEKFFTQIGFNSTFGPEIEDEFHNFDALNIWKNHPSRTNHDTFWFNSKNLLRTQTSSTQIRIMKNAQLPLRTIVPGKVYRNDSDKTHSPMFHQVEGLIVEKKINFSNLKWLMNEFLEFFFQKKIVIRFRNSYFPFTVPSAEIDIKMHNGKWLEILGCGMVHPSVLEKSGINSKKYIGCAFGLGVERITMIRYKIENIRSFFDNNIHFLKQFK